MKSTKYFVALGGVLVSCAALAALVSLRHFSFTHCRQVKPSAEAAEGTKEDPYALQRYRWMLLRNPRTDSIPRNIGTKENDFVNRLVRGTRSTAAPIVQEWRSRGPINIGGRTRALALDVKDEKTILAGGVSSGMWKSTDGGSSWRKTTAQDQLHSVSCIAQNLASGKRNIWYYGTGTAPIRGGSAAGPLGTNAFYRGDGIFKSVDGGESWTQIPSTVSGTAAETDPFDYIWGLVTFGTDGVLAATSSGLFRSTNSGDDWEHVLGFGDKYPSTEIAVTPSGVFYSTIGGDGPANGIYRSLNGEDWEQISPPGWPAKTIRTVIGLAQSNEQVVYYFTCVEGLQTQLLKYSETAGWTDLTANLPWDGELITYGGSMLLLKIKPDDENTLFLGTVGMYRSKDSGQSFEVIGAYSKFHVDQTALEFYPSDPSKMIVGNDGGLFRTEDNLAEPELDPSSGEYLIEWESLNNGYLTAQFYTVGLDHGTVGSETVSGGMQDNGCMFTDSSDSTLPWDLLEWGDGGASAISDGGEYHYTSTAATLRVVRHRFENGQHEYTEVTPSSARMGLWLTPFLLDPHDTRIMYLASRGELWRNSDLTQIPDVFPPAPTALNWSQLLNPKGDYVSALGMSEAMPRRLYCGTFDGKLLRIDDPHEGQPTPLSLSVENLPFGTYIHCIAVDPRDVNKLLVVFPNYEVVSIFASDDAGQHWTPVSGNLEEHFNGWGDGPSVRWVSVLYVQDQPVYFAGTSVGLFSTTELAGVNTAWLHEGAETIGNVVVDMIDTRQSDGYVVVGTHGNGVYSTSVTEVPPSVLYFPQVGDGSNGSVSFQTTLDLYNAGPDAAVKIEFFDSMGTPLSLDLGALGSGTQIEFTLRYGESVSAQTTGGGALKVGYAKVTTGPGIGGTAVFSFKSGGVVQYEAGLPATTGLTDFTIFMDKSLPTRDTGLALVNVGDGLARVTFRFYDKSFQLVATKSIADLDSNFDAGHHLARYATEIFSEIRQQGYEEGVITVESDQPLAAVTLRQRYDPAHPYPESVTTLSAFPVIPGRADLPEALRPAGISDFQYSYFPQVGSGTTGDTTFKTGLILVNTGSYSDVTVEFFSSEGSRVFFDMGSYGSNDRFSFHLAQGESISVETNPVSELQVGYAKISANRSVHGTAVFSYSKQGVTFFEAGVPAVIPRRKFAVFLDATAATRDTGIALLNPGPQDTEGSLRLFDPAHTLKATKTLDSFRSPFAAAMHGAKYATELFPEIRQQSIAMGVIEVVSEKPLAAITLRQHFDPSQPFPADLYLLTTFPVIPIGFE